MLIIPICNSWTCGAKKIRHEAHHDIILFIYMHRPYLLDPNNAEHLDFDHDISKKNYGNFGDARMTILVGKHDNSVLIVFYQKIDVHVN